MAKRIVNLRPGIRAGIAFLSRFERSGALAEMGDPGWDEKTFARPVLNFLHDALKRESSYRDAQRVEDFCSVISGFICQTATGIVPDASYIRTQWAARAAATTTKRRRRKAA